MEEFIRHKITNLIIHKIQKNECQKLDVKNANYINDWSRINSVFFWNYEINTEGDDNSGRWDYSTAVWGYDLSVVGAGEYTYPEEPEDGITLGEEFCYEIEVKDVVMSLKFTSEGHETKTFIKLSVL